LRSIGNRLEIHFDDSVSPEIVELEFPIGHRRRRAEAFPLLGEKFRRNTANRLGSLGADALLGLFMGAGDITELRVSALMNLLSRD
jgi:2-methylcitrate dehydratase